MIEAINVKMQIRIVIRHDLSSNMYYMYVYNLETNKCIEDHLCNDLQQAFYIAKEDYDILEFEFKDVN